MDKPAFDPNQPFETVKAEFDPNQPFESVSDERQEPSTLADIGRAFGQGLTFGFSDEALAALKASYEVATTKKELKDLPGLYRQLQQLEQQKVAEARERSSGLYTAAELAGAVAPALATAGLGALGAGARAGGALAAEGASLARAGAKALPGAVGEGAAAAPGFLQSILGAAKQGAKYGAIAAAGTTEAPIEETGEFIGEVGKGALAGATIGAGATGALKGASALGRKLFPQDTAFGRQAKIAFEEAKGEAPIFGEKAKDLQLARERGTAGKYTDELQRVHQALGDEITSTLLKSEQPLYSQDFSKIIATLGKEIPSDTRKFLVNYGEKLKQGTLSAIELRDLRNKVSATLSNYKEKLLPETIETLKRLETRSDELLSTVPGYTQASQRFHDFLQAAHETITEKGLDPKYRSRYFSDIKDGYKVLHDEIEDMIRTIGKPGTSADERSKTFLALGENIKKLGQKDPEIFQKFGFDEKTFMNAIKHEADLSAISQARRGYEPQTSMVRQVFNLLTPRGATFTGAQVLGKTVGAIERSTPTQLASKVYSATEPQLRKLSEYLSSNPATRRVGQNLAASLDKPSGIASRAILFSMMQDPEARKAIADMYSSEEGE